MDDIGYMNSDIQYLSSVSGVSGVLYILVILYFSVAQGRFPINKSTDYPLLASAFSSTGEKKTY